MSSRIGEIRGGQEPLDSAEPGGVESLRLAVGDARRQVAVADHDRAGVEQPLHLRPAFVPVGDVEQLHHVGAVVPLAVERPADLGADGGRVIRKRQQPAFPAAGQDLVADALRLGLLAALIQPLEGDEQPAHASSARMSSMVWRRRITVQRPSATRISGGSGRRL